MDNLVTIKFDETLWKVTANSVTSGITMNAEGHTAKTALEILRHKCTHFDSNRGYGEATAFKCCILRINQMLESIA